MGLLYVNDSEATLASYTFNLTYLYTVYRLLLMLPTCLYVLHSEVAQHDELLCLPCSTLVDLIASDELTVTSEEVVFQAVINWVKYDPTTRLPSLAEVLHHVRLSFVSPYFLFDKIDTESLLSKTTECRRYLDEAKKYHILKVGLTESDRLFYV